MKRTWFVSGEWNSICDVCGFKFKEKDLKDRWDGLKVCNKDWEPRHPQELIRPMPTERPLPWTRPEPTDQFLNFGTIDPATFTCSLDGQLCMSDHASADCAIVGNIIPPL